MIAGYAALSPCLPLGAQARPEELAGLLKKLPPHPRLHLDADGWSGLRERIRQDDLLGHWYELLLKTGEQLLTAPMAEYKLKGPRLLGESRRALQTVSTLAGLYRLGGDRRFAERARAELRAICEFPSWHPPHFLDVAEMTNAAGLGYDWLYDVMPEAERTRLREKILAFGLRPGLHEYESNVGWSRPYANNWGQVCAGGLTVGALAIAGDGADGGGALPLEPAAILGWTIAKVPNNLLNYAPDGGWQEGPGYWSYATHYTCAMLSALQSCLGTDFRLSEASGFSSTGDFRVASIGPSGLFFNYADGDARVAPAAEMLWLSRRFAKPLYAVSEHTQVARTTPGIFHLVWSQPGEGRLVAGSPALDLRFSKIDLAYLRSSWTDPQAFFVGIKGGRNNASHAHLDLGSFVFDALGERWAMDLGPDNYDLPDYFGKARWTYYRMRSEGHNTLTLGTENQVVTATAALVDFRSTPAQGLASVDLSAAYAPVLKSVRRTVTLARTPSRQLTLVDRVESAAAATVRWNLHTDAEITLEGHTALLRKQGKQIKLQVLSPENVSLRVTSSSGPPPEAQAPAVRTLIAECILPAGVTEIRVILQEA